MNKRAIHFLVVIIAISLCACGPVKSSKSSNTEAKVQKEEKTTSKDKDKKKTKEEKATSKDKDKKKSKEEKASLTTPEGIIQATKDLYAKRVEEISTSKETLSKTIGSDYDSMKANYPVIKKWYEDERTGAKADYQQTLEYAKLFYPMLKKDSLPEYSEWNNQMDDFYKAWDRGMTDLYGALNKAYEDLYNDLDDYSEKAYDTHAYEEVSDFWTQMYDDYSDEWTQMYDDRTDAWDKLYTLHQGVWEKYYDKDTDIQELLDNAVIE